MEEKNELELLDTQMGAFNIILNGENKKKGELWLNWHYLQVYATWGLRLPSSQAALKAKLNIDSPAQYLFFEPMTEAYKNINEACEYFMTTTFPGMVDIGGRLRNFAREATTEGEMFKAVIDSINENDKEAAIEFIVYLQGLARENSEKAEKIGGYLAEFGSKLTSIQGQLINVQTRLDEDEKTTQATIDHLSGGENIAGSLLQLQKLRETQKDEYDHFVVVASTTVTYAWVIPVGLIAASVVAGVYGDKAVKQLEEVERTEELVKSKTLELSRANASRNIQMLAQNGLDSTISNTNMAIEKTNDVKNAWLGTYANLETIKNKLQGMLGVEEDGEITLKSKSLIKLFAEKAEKAWNELLPDLNQLMDDPYITVEPEEMSVSQLRESVKEQVSVAA